MVLRRTALSEDGKTLKITVSWFGWPSLVLAVFSTLMFPFVFRAFDHPSPVNADFSTSLGLFLFSGVAVVLFYVTAAYFMNRTEIVVDKQWIVVRHFPLPWLGQKVEVASLKDILVEVDDEGGSTFTIRALTHAGKKLKLTTFYTRKDANFVEEQIDKFLNVRDYQDYYFKRNVNQRRWFNQ